MHRPTPRERLEAADWRLMPVPGIALVVVAAIIAINPLYRRHQASACRREFAASRQATDSALVDEHRPGLPIYKFFATTVACGLLRRAGRL
jgi:hypothetical protein